MEDWSPPNRAMDGKALDIVKSWPAIKVKHMNDANAIPDGIHILITPSVQGEAERKVHCLHDERYQGITDVLLH
jgi:hypothetical protein